MSGYTSPNQIRPVQLPDFMGAANAMSSQSLNAMREDQLLQQSQQLRGAEAERGALRELFSRPGFDPMAPGSAREILLAAPTTGAATFNALSGALREQRQAGTAATETALKNFEISREALRGIAALPPDQQPRAWAAWRAQTEASVPGTRGFIPQTFSPEAYATMIAKADDIAKSISERPTALQGPGGVPVLVDRRSGTYQMGTEVPAGGVLAPRAAGPEMTPGQMAAAEHLRTREGFRAEPYFDVNAHRAGFGSDTTTRADGSVVPVRPGMTVSREDAERDLARRIPQFEQRVVAAIGPEAYAAMPPNAQAALISIAYNYGSIPGRIRNAAMSGDPAALAKAVEGLAGDNRGVNAGRRRDEATMIAGAPTNAMAPPGAAPANAMLVSQDALAAEPPLAVPDFARLATPSTIAEADRNRRTMDVQQSQATARAAAEVQRETAPARAAEAGQTTAAQTRAKLEAEEAVKRRQDAERLDVAIREVEKIIRPGGLLQQATGSGAGALRDTLGNLVGMSSRAADAAAAIPPIADLVLKMVPRFEGPQSERDVKVYEKAAGDLSNSALPNVQRLAAAREILRLMRDRRGQFSYSESGGGGAPASPAPAAPSAPAATGFSEGQTATGPNGQRIVFRGGQWVPMQ